MPKYIVKTINDRNLVIEADGYISRGDHFEFFVRKDETSTTVGSALKHSVFAIVENDAIKDDFYYFDDATPGEDEDEDDVCLDCRFQEFLESKEFFDQVDSIVEFWHGGSKQDEPTEAEPPQEAPNGQ